MMTSNESITTKLDKINQTKLEKVVSKFGERFRFKKIIINAKILAGLPVDEINHIPLSPGSGMSEDEVILVIN